ncbi:MAG: hypothetical protein ACLFVP_05315 [Candidatus Bathyarchaeia archaeon]
MDEEENIIWVRCPDCGSKIGIFLTTEVARVEKPAEVLEKEALQGLTLEGFRDRLSSEGVDLSLIMVQEEENKFVVSPKGYLGDPWRGINDVIDSMGGEWVSAGKESRWEISKEAIK